MRFMAVLIAAHRTGSTVSGNCLAKMRFSFRKNSTHNQLRLPVAISLSKKVLIPKIANLRQNASPRRDGEYRLCAKLRWLPLTVREVRFRSIALPKCDFHSAKFLLITNCASPSSLGRCVLSYTALNTARCTASTTSGVCLA